jgi:N-acetylglutamate synthase-like GNAT family acetyltransferase
MLEILIQLNKILDVIDPRRQTADRELTDMAIREEEMQMVGGERANQIEIRPLKKGEDATAFRTLNEEWITRYFTLEKMDRETLGDPQKRILEKGGYIFMVYADDQAVGCVALIPIGNGVYELSKMAVSPELRGLGIGRRLLQHAIAEARRIGARSLFLGSNAKLENAVHLYESVGFRHVAPENIPPMPYTRANVFMELPL